jgi:hypothetical protein
MPSVELVGRICLSFSAALILTAGIWHVYRGSSTHYHRLTLMSALVGSIGLAFLVSGSSGSLYGDWEGACSSVVIGLEWAVVFLPGRSKRSALAASIVSALLVAGCWLPTAPDLPRALQGAWFISAQIMTAIGVGFWLYAACLALQSDGGPLQRIQSWAFLFQTVGALTLAIGAHQVWGQALSGDPVECWWLFAVVLSALAVWGWRQRGWDVRLTAALALAPALLAWFGSWFIIRALHLASLYVAGS